MASNQDPALVGYPLPAYHYKVTIGGQIMAFAQVSGLSIEHEPVIYRHGLSFAMGTKIIPGMRQPVKLTLRRGVVKGRSFLSTWLNETHTAIFKATAQDIQVDLCDEAGAAVVRWKVLGALPSKIEAPAFDANSNEAAIETLELTARELQIEYIT